ncbi:MAG: spore coat protein GerQ [Bacilli bacterium]
MNEYYNNEEIFDNPMYTSPPNNLGIDSSTTSDNQMYIERLIRQNIGKIVKIHTTFPGSLEERDKVFYGVVQDAARDNIVVKSSQTGYLNVIPAIYVNYIVIEQ